MSENNEYGKYTSMAIYIDKHIYEEKHNDVLIFKYLRLLLGMFAHKRGYFLTKEDVDGFSIMGATRIYMRLTSSKQYLPDGDPKKLPKIKSVLNYIKKLLYPLKVDYQKWAFGKVFDADFDGDIDDTKIREDLLVRFKKGTEGMQIVECEDYFKSLPGIIKRVVKDTPYAKNKVLAQNLYMSCLITLLRSITVSNENKKRLDVEAHTRQIKLDSVSNDVYFQERSSSLLLYHLDDSFKGLVSVLINKIRKEVSQEICEILDYYNPTDDMLENVLMQPLAELGEEDD